jgi:hypothetical protein
MVCALSTHAHHQEEPISLTDDLPHSDRPTIAIPWVIQRFSGKEVKSFLTTARTLVFGVATSRLLSWLKPIILGGNMKKHILIITANLVLASNLNASEGLRGEYCFHPTFQKNLKRLKPVGWHSFQLLSLEKKPKKKAIFINWRKLYWGKLSDLVYGVEEVYVDDVQEIAGTEEQNSSLLLDTEESQSFAKELRHELKSFTEQYGLKIMWRKKSLDLLDGTAAFLEYWNRGFSQEKLSKVISFTELCSLSFGDKSVKDTGVQESKAKAIRTQSLPKNTPFANLLLRQGT